MATNFTLLAPEGTVTEAGTTMAEVLLESCTWRPPDGAAMSVESVQESETAPVKFASLQVNALISGRPEDPPAEFGGTREIEKDFTTPP